MRDEVGLTHLHDPECLGREGDCEDVQDGKERVESFAGHSDNSKECASVREGELEGNGCGLPSAGEDSRSQRCGRDLGKERSLWGRERIPVCNVGAGPSGRSSRPILKSAGAYTRLLRSNESVDGRPQGETDNTLFKAWRWTGRLSLASTTTAPVTTSANPFDHHLSSLSQYGNLHEDLCTPMRHLPRPSSFGPPSAIGSSEMTLIVAAACCLLPTARTTANALLLRPGRH